jgi:hypothetical protein
MVYLTTLYQLQAICARARYVGGADVRPVQ